MTRVTKPAGHYRLDAAGTDYQPHPWLVFGFYALVLGIALIPVVSTDILPLADLPNHMARAYILNNLGSDSELQSYYSISWHLLSFQSTDLVLPPLAKLFGLFPAARIFVAATFMLLVGGVAAVHGALFGRVGLWPAASAVLLYNFLLAWGLVSYLFTIGLGLLVFAAWIATGNRGGLLRLAAFSAATLILFFCHFFAFAAYAVLVAGYELSRKPSGTELFAGGRRRALVIASAGMPFLIPAVLFLYSHDGGQTHTKYGDLTDKVRAILSPTTMYLNWLDFSLTIAFLVMIGLCLRQRLFTLAVPTRLAIMMIAGLAIVMPNQLTSVWGVDFRLPTLLALMMIAGSNLELRGPRQAAAFATVLVVLMLVRVGFVAWYFHGYQVDFTEFREAAAKLERGSRIMVLQDLDDHRASPAPIIFPYRHIASLAVIDRDVFLPYLFTFATPLEFTGKGREIVTDRLTVTRHIQWHPTKPAFAAVSPETVLQIEQVGRGAVSLSYFSSTLDWTDWPEHFDYLIDFDFGRPGNPVPGLLTEVLRGSYFSIFRIHPPITP